MRRVFSSHDPMLAGYLRSVLEESGIACLVKNEYLQGGVGELPPNECWPELWIVEDGDEGRAKTIIDEALRPGVDDGPWRCPACGEWIEAGFSDCWRCAAD